MRYLTSIVLSLPLIGAYAIFAVGIVLIYRASKVLNLAHGAMAMIPAFLTYEMSRLGVPVLLALPLGIATGALLGLAVERIFVRRLRSESLTAQTVGTVAALGILVAVAVKIWGTSAIPAPRVFPAGWISVGLSSVQIGELALFAVMLVVTGGVFVLIQRTDLGLMMRGTAESRLAAGLMGVDPDRITSFTWMLGGGLAGLAGILLASVTSLHPFVLTLQALPAFIAALLGGLGSIPGALVGAAIVGVTQGLVPVLGPLGQAQGAPQLFLAVVAIAVMAARGKSLVAADARAGMDASKGAQSGSQEGGDRAAAPERSRRLIPSKWFIGAAAVALFPWIAPFSLLGAANKAAGYALVAVSLVVLIGWVGQISLGHAALVGVGAYATGWASAALHIPFPLSILVAAAAAGGIAAVLGLVALRVRGLYLAVATLVFSWMASEFLFRQHWFVRYDQIPDRPIGVAGTFPFFDFADRRIFYLVAWAIVAAAIYAASNVRESKTGRAFFAVRGSEMAAASLGIDVMRYKLLAFSVSGAIAGVAGNIIMVDARVVTADQFTFDVSLFFLAIAVVGGLSSLGGAVGAAALFAGLTELFFRFPALSGFLALISGFLLAVTLLAYRGGLAMLPEHGRRLANGLRQRLSHTLQTANGSDGDAVSTDRATRHAGIPAVASTVLARTLRGLTSRGGAGARRMGSDGAPRSSSVEPPLDLRAAIMSARAEPNGEGKGSPGPMHAVEIPAGSTPDGAGDAFPEPPLEVRREELVDRKPQGPREELRPMIEAQHVTVKFGGLVAVNDASLAVREGEIVGLIGPNGAGKTTLFNAIAGYNSPTSGRIAIYGRDVTALPVHRRAEIGVARTFQMIQLFGELSVHDNLLVATHVHNGTGFPSHVVASDRSIAEEERARARVKDVMDVLGLQEVARRPIGDLPFGVLRMVEVARALVTGFRIIMLDEPASGLDNTETDELIDILRLVRGLGVSLLLIEHDVRMVTSVSDYIYVLDQGRMIAQGRSEEIQRDPSVIAAYLGEPAKETVSD